MNILKFGGTSVANSSSLQSVIEIVKSQQQESVVVVSALGGITNLLIDFLYRASQKDDTYRADFKVIRERHLEPIEALLPKEIQKDSVIFLDKKLSQLEGLYHSVFQLEEVTERTLSKVSAFGEILSSQLICTLFKHHGIDVSLHDATQLIATSEKNNKLIVDFAKTENQTKKNFEKSKAQVHLVPGYIAGDESGNLTTLGRGGSDFSAAILANILAADTLEIWTDVSGMFTAHPKLVSQAQPIPRLSYYEAMELSHFGAKVIYPPTLQPLVEKNIPTYIKNTFKPEDAGTLIHNETDTNGQIVKGISHIDDVALVSLEGSGMVGIPGFSKRLFETLYTENINIIMITQASSEHSICLGVKAEDAQKAKEVIDEHFAFEISLNKVYPARLETDLVNIAVVGDKMKEHQGISGKLFSSLGANNINIRAIAQGASERNISIITDQKNVQKALNTLHESFFESQVKQLNLFITGVGNVGGKLLEQIDQQKDYLESNLRLKIRIMALSNSRKMLLSEQPIDLSNWKDALENNSIPADRKAFFEHAKALNLRNSIFVDNTANENIAMEYGQYLANSMGIVTCNKIACADQFENYQNLKKTARQFGSPFLFETNVGAGLPIIDTLNNLIASGDQVVKIQAVLSGSLNFVFNNYTKDTSFVSVVQQAMEEGYTEPDPKIDLSGVDVARKILILARESGMAIELKDIENNSFLPQACLDTPDNSSFFKSLETHQSHFEGLLNAAQKDNSNLKYVAQLENGKASVGLQHIPKGHDFYNLEGSDNIILFYTNRYSQQPLIVKGAGAGAAVTASGIFADIIRIGKQ